ncbi:hypothetical protein [Neokomagataea anthophila]|uniref:Phage tail protein n=1 Tax=Neokomagataea anthophila TaxID=2826925 RepID=A0ABS5EA09_9PROT|nr:hypothetical protein [Neokomagataea anthophila]MBR0560333.1 hypothetical protein [Neokomagataea anthophila]
MDLTLSNIGNAIGAMAKIGSSSPVILGDVVLTGIEVPDYLQVGGRQMMVIHRLPGGQRIIDALGNDPGRLELRGRFLGGGAQARAQSIERMRNVGKAISFSAAGLSLSVFISEFSYRYEDKGALCTYSLTLEAVHSATSHESTSDVELFGENIDKVENLLSSVISGPIRDAFNLTSQMGTVAAQIMPVAAMLGAGGTVSRVMNAISKVQSIAQASQNWGESTVALQRIGEQLGVAGGELTSLAGETGDQLDTLLINNMGALGLANVHAGLESTAVDASLQVKRALSRIGNMRGA